MFSNQASFFSNPFAQNNNQTFNYNHVRQNCITMLHEIEVFFQQLDIRYVNQQLNNILEILFRTNYVTTQDYGLLLGLFILGPSLGVIISTLGGTISLMSYIFQLANNGQNEAKDHLETSGKFFILSFICTLGSLVSSLCLIAKIANNFLNESETQNRHSNSY